MRNIIKVIGGITVLLLYSSFLKAQDFKTDLEIAYKQYECSDQLLIQMDTRKVVDGKEVQEIKTTMKKYTDYFFYDMGAHKMLTTPTSYLLIDDQKQVIFYSPRYPEMEDKQEFVSKEQIEKIVKESEKIEYKGEQNGRKIYHLLNSEGEVSTTEIYFDNKTKLINEVVYHYNNKIFDMDMKLYMKYNQINLNPDFLLDNFLETAFVSFKEENGQTLVLPKGKYAKYEISVQNF